jgi:hypothetical protein
MLRRPTKELFKFKFFTKEMFERKINNDVVNESFENHCNEVAKNLNIDPIVVKELLLDNSLTVLSLLQKSAYKFINIKINITGYFSFTTDNNSKFKMKKY